MAENFLWKEYHLLIVEDDLVNYELICEMLRLSGIKITHAITGLEAVRFCRKDLSINLVLMDMRLPEMDGYQATKTIKEFRKTLPIIAHTAHAFTEDREKCISFGCDEYLTKPVKTRQLLDTLGIFLNKPV